MKINNKKMSNKKKKMKTLKLKNRLKKYMMIMEDTNLMIHFMNIVIQREAECLSIIQPEIHIRICLRMKCFGDTIR
jgi:hypothetical protein